MRSDGHKQQLNGHKNLEPHTGSSGLPDSVPALMLLRFPAIHARTGLSRSTIWRLERRGEFPRRHRISTNAVAWIEEEVMTWIRTRIGDVAV
jgi:prophage regulatory protein